MRRGPVEIHVEELVLHGFAARDRHRIAAALERELARLVERDGAAQWSARGDRGMIDGGSFEASRAMRADAVGVEIARAVLTGVDR